VEDETGDNRPTDNASSIDVALAASLRPDEYTRLLSLAGSYLRDYAIL
jgi:hypothetical protein